MSNDHHIEYNRTHTSITHKDGTKQNNDNIIFKTKISDKPPTPELYNIPPKPESQSLINNPSTIEAQQSKKNKNIKLIIVLGIISLFFLFGIIGIIVFFTYNTSDDLGPSTPNFIIQQNISHHFPQDTPPINQIFPPQINQIFPQDTPPINQIFPPQINQTFYQNIPQINHQPFNNEFNLGKTNDNRKNKTICLVCILKEQYNNYNKDDEINVIPTTRRQLRTIPTTRRQLRTIQTIQREQSTPNTVIQSVYHKEIHTDKLQIDHTLTFVIDITNQIACTYSQFFQCWNAIIIDHKMQTQIEVKIPEKSENCFGIKIDCSLLNVFGNFECFKESCNLQDIRYMYIPQMEKWISPNNVYFKSNKQYTQSYQYSSYTHQRIFINAFNHITNITHTSNILVIDIGYQKQCSFNYKKQCWDAKFITDFKQTIQLVQIEVYYIMEKCYFFHSYCPYNVNKQCFKQLCPTINYQTVNLYSIQTKTFTKIIPNNIYILHTGNFHSSWQNTDTTNFLTLNHIKQAEDAQSLFAEINVNTIQITQQELVISYNTIKLCFDCISTYNSKHKMYNTIVTLAEILINNEQYNTQILLHERIHEFINAETMTTFKLMYKDIYDRYWYTGKKVIEVVGKNNQLLLQDQHHLGNWGVETSPSSYDHVYAFLGQYTLAAFEDVGFVSNLNRQKFIGTSELKRVAMKHSSCGVY